MNRPPVYSDSPLHMGGMPPLAEALLTVAVLIAVAYLASLCWAWMSGPLARHACGACDPVACQHCKDAARDARVSDYAAQAKANQAERAAATKLLSKEGV